MSGVSNESCQRMETGWCNRLATPMPSCKTINSKLNFGHKVREARKQDLPLPPSRCTTWHFKNKWSLKTLVLLAWGKRRSSLRTSPALYLNPHNRIYVKAESAWMLAFEEIGKSPFSNVERQDARPFRNHFLLDVTFSVALNSEQMIREQVRFCHVKRKGVSGIWFATSSLRQTSCQFPPMTSRMNIGNSRWGLASSGGRTIKRTVS